MREFLQEWGATILTAIAVVALIAIVLLFKDDIKDKLSNTFNSVSGGDSGSYIDQAKEISTTEETP